MKLKYSNEASDFDAVMSFQMLETDEGAQGFKKGFLKAQLAVLPISFLFYMISGYWNDDKGWSGLIALIVLEATLLLFGKKLSLKAVKMQQQKNGEIEEGSPFLQEKTISPSFNGINIKMGKEQGLVAWKQITKFVRNSEFIFVYVGQEIQLIIPKRAFSDGAKGFGKFYAECKRFGANQTTF